jgi:zinc protease
VQNKPKYLKVDDPHAQAPGFWMTWKAPPKRQGDYYALGIAQKVLSGGTSSRLYQRMVKGDQIALSADAQFDERRGPGLFESMVIFKPNTTAEKARDVVWDELNKLKEKPVSQQELDTAKNQILRELFSAASYSSLQRSLGRAETLAEYTSFFNDPAAFDQDIVAYLQVTPADVQKAAQRTFTRGGITVVDVVPVEKKAAAGNEKTESK